MRKLSLAILRNLLASALAVVLLASAALAQDKPQIVTVNYPLKYFAERLLADQAEITFPVPEDVDPSFWRPLNCRYLHGPVCGPDPS